AVAAVEQRTPVQRVDREQVLDPLVAAERAARHLELGDVEVVAPGAVDLQLLVREDVPRKAEARSQLVVEVELDGVLRQGRVDGRAVIRDLLLLGADTEVEGQVRKNLPAVLNVEAEVLAVGAALGDEATHAERTLGADDAGAEAVREAPAEG